MYTIYICGIHVYMLLGGSTILNIYVMIFEASLLLQLQLHTILYYTILCLPNIAMASLCYLFPSVRERSSVVGSTKLSSSLKTCREINRENDTTNRPCSRNRSLRKINTKPKSYITQKYSMYTQMCMYSILVSRVDALAMRQLKID